jgi:hypothetical protein
MRTISKVEEIKEGMIIKEMYGDSDCKITNIGASRISYRELDKTAHSEFYSKSVHTMSKKDIQNHLDKGYFNKVMKG